MIPGTLVYSSPGVLTQEGEFNDHRPVKYVSRPTADSLSAMMMSGQEETLNVQPNTIQSEGAGVLKFTDTDGQNFQVRPIEDIDGEWLSGLHTVVPADALRSLVADTDPEGTDQDMSQYLQDKRETMVAFQFPDDDYLFGLLYINKFGAYIRLDDNWLRTAPDDDTFDDTYPYMVNADTVDDFVAAWDQGPISVSDAESKGWVTSPDNDSPAEIDADSDVPTDAPDTTDTTEDDTDD